MHPKLLNSFRSKGNPDILTCLADLSSDEVFTPPKIANQMLDMLPESIWSDETATFLDPCSKSGVFLREITKRLNIGLEKKIPNRKIRVNHILKKQVFGIAITKLTSLISRRTLYCSKYANNKELSQAKFDTRDGNLKYIQTDHSWKKDRCEACGANKSGYDRNEKLESHAYSFIHVENPAKIFNNMKFDVIIGNPPYQLKDGGAQASASPIYHKFIKQAMSLSPKYLAMIIPARWYSGGKGLDDFRTDMLSDRRIKELHDFQNEKDCFDGVSIRGGVCYFLWEKTYSGDCKIFNHNKQTIVSEVKRPLLKSGFETFIRQNESISIIEKVKIQNEKSFSEIVSSRKPFGLSTNFKDYKKTPFKNSIKIHLRGVQGFVSKDQLPKNQNWVDQHKVIIAEASEKGASNEATKILGMPQYLPPGTCCSETYLVIGPFNTKVECTNVISYIKTKIFRFFVSLIKNTQHGTKKVYSLVPMQNFNESWTDKKLYEKYNLTQKERDYIESMIKPMN